MAKLDAALDAIVTSQIRNLDPKARAKAESKIKRDSIKLKILKNASNRMKTDSARSSAEAWFDTIATLQAKDKKSSKKDKKRNAKFLRQVQATAIASNEAWAK